MHVEAAAVRRSVIVLFACISAFTLLAASPSPSLLGTPILVVYPFSVNGSDVNKEAGSRLAVTIATQIANLGGVAVKPAAPGVERQKYLDAAQRESADYYIAGYVTPLGDGVSVVEQLVSTQTGIVVYSNTAQIRTFADAAGQGDVLREALLRHQSRNLGAYAAPPPPAITATPTPAPGSATHANLGRLFGRKQQRAAAPVATPAPAATVTPPTTAGAVSNSAPSPAPSGAVAKPRSGYGVLVIGGAAESERRVFAGAALRNDVLADHQRISNASTREAACSVDSVSALLGGNLATRAHNLLGSHRTTATLELLAYDCAGSVIYRKTFVHDVRGDWKDAVDLVVATAVAAFLHQSAGTHG